MKQFIIWIQLYLMAVLLLISSNLLAQPTITSTITNVSCNGGNDGEVAAAVAGGTAPYTYLWSDPFASTTATVTGLAAGCYTLTVTDLVGATATHTACITEPVAMSGAITASSFAICSANPVLLTSNFGGGTPMYTYQWYLNNQPLPTAIGANHSATIAGDYHLEVTDMNACVVISPIITLGSGTIPNLSVTPSLATVCTGDNASFTASVSPSIPSNYQWSNGVSGPALTTNIAGSYTVTASDASEPACFSTTSVQLNNFPNLNISIDSIDNVRCNGAADGSIYFTPSGGAAPYMFSINGGSFVVGPYEVQNLAAGTYLITIMDANGCQFSTAGTVLEPSVLMGQDTSYFVAPDSTLDFCIPYSGTAFAISSVLGVNQGSIVDNGGGCFSYTPSTISGAADTVLIYVCDLSVTYEHQVIIETASCVWAGDTDTNQVANNFDLLPIGVNYGMIGDTRPGADLNWDCEPMRDWNVVSSGSVDPKHSDTNGDGIINDDDTLAITLNWGESYVKDLSPIRANGIPIYVDTTSAMPGDTVLIDVVLGTNLVPANSVYGLAFSLIYDNSIIDSSSVVMHYSSSWLGTKGTDMLTIEKDFYPQGKVEIGMTRIDYTNISGIGAIAQIQLTIKDDVLKSSLLRMDFDVKDVKLIDSSGAVLAIAPQATSSVVLVSSMQQSYRDLDFEIFPNPTNGVINLNLPASDQQILQLFNVHGQLLQSWQVDAESHMQLDLQAYLEGAYVLQLVSREGVATKKVLKVR